jgi:hypothetical protein
MQLTDLTGIGGVALALVWLAMRLAKLREIRQRGWLALALLLTVLIPWGGLSIAEFVRGISGDLSISTLLLLLVLQFGRKTINIRPFFWLIALASLALYPFALGLTLFDSYRIGFGNYLFLLTILIIVLISVWRKHNLIAIVLSLAVLAWSLGYAESSNVWDYLIDPWLAIVAWVTLLRKRS